VYALNDGWIKVRFAGLPTHHTFTPDLKPKTNLLSKRGPVDSFQVKNGQVVKINTKLYLVVRISVMKI
jgi:hypothetical protein